MKWKSWMCNQIPKCGAIDYRPIVDLHRRVNACKELLHRFRIEGNGNPRSSWFSFVTMESFQTTLHTYKQGRRPVAAPHNFRI